MLIRHLYWWNVCLNCLILGTWNLPRNQGLNLRTLHWQADSYPLHHQGGEGNGNPLQCSCLETPMDGGAWWAAVYGVARVRVRHD